MRVCAYFFFQGSLVSLLLLHWILKDRFYYKFLYNSRLWLIFRDLPVRVDGLNRWWMTGEPLAQMAGSLSPEPHGWRRSHGGTFLSCRLSDTTIPVAGWACLLPLLRAARTASRCFWERTQPQTPPARLHVRSADLLLLLLLLLFFLLLFLLLRRRL